MICFQYKTICPYRNDDENINYTYIISTVFT